MGIFIKSSMFYNGLATLATGGGSQYFCNRTVNSINLENKDMMCTCVFVGFFFCLFVFPLSFSGNRSGFDLLFSPFYF